MFDFDSSRSISICDESHMKTQETGRKKRRLRRRNLGVFSRIIDWRLRIPLRMRTSALIRLAGLNAGIGHLAVFLRPFFRKENLFQLCWIRWLSSGGDGIRASFHFYFIFNYSFIYFYTLLVSTDGRVLKERKKESREYIS